MSAITIARELVELSPPSTLVRAYLEESLADVFGVHRSVLVARLGGFSPSQEDAAVSLLREALAYIDADLPTEDPTEEAIIAALREVAP